MNKVIRGMRRCFNASWLNTEMRDTQRNRPLVALLDEAVRLRQGKLLSASADTAGHPFSICSLVGVLNRTICRLEDGTSPSVSPLHVTTMCALVGELCGSALCHNDEEAGGIYPRVTRADRQWRQAHEPLYVLRHAVFHPGAVRSEEIKSDSTSGSLTHIDRLRAFLVRKNTNPTAAPLAASLTRSRDAIAGEWAALWALQMVIKMGNYELNRMGFSGE